MSTKRRSSGAILSPEPSPNQWVRPEKRSHSWTEGLVYDPSKNTVDIRSRGELEGDPSYLVCPLPSSGDVISIFLSKDETQVFAFNTIRKGEGKIFIGVLKLEKLDLVHRLKRTCNLLKKLYVVKPEASRA